MSVDDERDGEGEDDRDNHVLGRHVVVRTVTEIVKHIGIERWIGR